MRFRDLFLPPSPSLPKSRLSGADDRYWLHITLFLLTFASTVFAGATWTNRSFIYQVEGAYAFIEDGLKFAFALLVFLTVHEFGHYFAARIHRIRVSLPYFIPLPLLGIGTLGAVIRIREQVPSLRSLFDIGVAGPMAGFAVGVLVLFISLLTLPPPDYVLDLQAHRALKSEVIRTGHFPAEMPVADATDAEVNIVVGQTILYWALTSLFADTPPMYEMYHYPGLFAGWLALFFTALNLLPVGQLDGGHILYALVGPQWHPRIARGFLLVLLLSGGVGFMGDLGPGISDFRSSLGPFNWFMLTGIYYLYLRKIFNGNHAFIAPSLLGLVAGTGICLLVPSVAAQIGHSFWLIWCLLIIFIIKVDHPPVLYMDPISPARRRLGIFAMVVFVLCFSIQPFSVV